MRPIYDSNGKRVSTGTLLGKGGEGSVFEVCGQNAVVAKVYERAATAEHAAKLSAMTRLRTDRLVRLAAWPLDTLHEQPNGPIIGLLMPRAGGKPVHQLYGPKSRLAEFPKADWRFLIFTASNIARAFHVIHEHGHVIGDVNHGNLFVTNQATVMLIDCDSFQIHLPNRRFGCEVGVETYTPPELQGKRFRDVTRTSNHDNFGLAVLIFQLLFLGRHPFSGTYQGGGEMPIARAITEFRFAYGPHAHQRQMKPPPGTPALEAASPVLTGLFDRAFGKQGSQSAGRPLAKNWIDALEQLSCSLKLCSRHTGHYYLNTLAACPWCDVEGRVGILLFNYAVAVKPAPSSFDLTGVWKRIVGVAAPGTPPSPPTRAGRTVAPSPNAVALGRQYRQGVAGIATMLGANRQRAQAVAILRATLRAVQTRCDELVRRWQTEVSDHEFQKARQVLEAKRTKYIDLPHLYAQRRRDLEGNREQAQRQRYLDSIRIDNAAIPNIGPGRKATLQSFGIETAGDVVERQIRAIPGFGAALTGYLVAWRRAVEKQFRFNPTQRVDPADIRAMEAQLNQMRILLEQDLLKGEAELTSICERIRKRRLATVRTLEEALLAVAQAEADLSVL